MKLLLLPLKIVWWIVKLPFAILGLLLGGWGNVGKDLKNISFKIGG